MPAGLTSTPSDSPVGQQKKGASSSVAVIPFARASKWHIEQSNTSTATVTPSSAQQVLNFPIASYGYLSAVLLTVQGSAITSNSAITPFEDAPWSYLSQVQLSDVNGVPIFQLSGFHAYLAAKYGGYRMFAPDNIINGASSDGNAAKALIGNGGPPGSVLTGPNGGYYSPPTTASAGAFKFILPIWLEFGLDGMGCLPNMDASARYNLQITIPGSPLLGAAGGPIYAVQTAGTTQTLTITVEALCRSQPPSQDMFGNQNSVSPPAVGTVQYWTAQTITGMGTGAQTVQLTRVGNLIRNHILVFRDSGNTPRATAESTDMPSSMEFDWDVGQRYVCNLGTYRFFNGYPEFGLDEANGVLLLPNTLDPDKLPISEYGDEWMGTVGATKLTLRYTQLAGTVSLSILTNDIVPASSQVYSAPRLAQG
jgi:hypothetical protein